MQRTLSLKAEHLTDLTADELAAAVAGAEVSGLPCKLSVAGCGQPVSQVVMSACGCLTSYCSIDVC